MFGNAQIKVMVRWRSWLSHLSNTQKVLSSSLGRINFAAPVVIFAISKQGLIIKLDALLLKYTSQRIGVQKHFQRFGRKSTGTLPGRP